MASIFARHALLDGRWAEQVRLTLLMDGTIGTVHPDSRPEPGDERTDLLLPGMVNAHSHAFQRALAGLTESGEESGANFWSWRDGMYRLANALDREACGVVARHLFVEMLQAGYTHVVEFHYAHGADRSAGEPQARAEALVQAAGEAGIGMTLLPVLYGRAGFDRQEPEPAQRGFVLDPDACIRLMDVARGRVDVGLALHSLRAVSLEEAREALALVPTDVPIHIHISEQRKEVESCRQAHGATPIHHLIDRLPVDEHWSLVHATHATPEELRAAARAGVTLVLCPTTEANLGDGLFPVEDWIGEGALAVGSDSHVAVDPAWELRTLELGARLRRERRVVAGDATRLWDRAAQGGARAAGISAGRIAPGQRADLLGLELTGPLYAGRGAARALDTFLFAQGPSPARDVWRAGRHVVRGGRHPDAPRAAADFARVAGRFARSLFQATRP